MNILEGLLKFGYTHSALETMVLFLVVCLIIIYIRDSAARDKRIEMYNDKIDENSTTLKEHMREEENRLDKLANAIDSLTTVIGEIKLTLVENRIHRADVSKEQWELVMARLNETAEITFSGALFNACLGCDETNCEYLQEFSKLIQDRRRESWHIWEQAAVPRSILTIVEEVNGELYKKVTEQYIPDIISICHNDMYKNVLSKEAKIELLKAKIEAIKEKVKRDWYEAINRRVNIIAN